jgi:hypothetical protein
MYQYSPGYLEFATREVASRRLQKEERLRWDGVAELLDMLKVVSSDGDNLTRD